MGCREVRYLHRGEEVEAVEDPVGQGDQLVIVYFPFRFGERRNKPTRGECDRLFSSVWGVGKDTAAQRLRTSSAGSDRRRPVKERV